MSGLSEIRRLFVLLLVAEAAPSSFKAHVNFSHARCRTVLTWSIVTCRTTFRNARRSLTDLHSGPSLSLPTRTLPRARVTRPDYVMPAAYYWSNNVTYWTRHDTTLEAPFCRAVLAIFMRCNSELGTRIFATGRNRPNVTVPRGCQRSRVTHGTRTQWPQWPRGFAGDCRTQPLLDLNRFTCTLVFANQLQSKA